MIFTIKGTDRFYKQLNELEEKSKRILKDKLDLLKENPYRFKKLQGRKLKLFRIRFNIKGKESRLVYAVIEPNVILICFLDRSKGYKELDRYIKELE